jgi:hypothetical protein
MAGLMVSKFIPSHCENMSVCPRILGICEIKFSKSYIKPHFPTQYVVPFILLYRAYTPLLERPTCPEGPEGPEGAAERQKATAVFSVLRFS